MSKKCVSSYDEGKIDDKEFQSDSTQLPPTKSKGKNVKCMMSLVTDKKGNHILDICRPEDGAQWEGRRRGLKKL